MNKVLVVSAGMIHPNWLARYHFSQLIKGMDGIQPVFTTSIQDLTRLATESFSAAVLYFHRSDISHEALSSLTQFVTQGGGLFAVHSASASFKQTRGYFDIIGGRFVSHGKIEAYTIRPSGSAPDLFPGVQAFSVKDELYIHEYQNDVNIHFFADNHGSDEPAVWTRTHGRGKVAYSAFGHCAKVMSVPQVQMIMEKCLLWVLTPCEDTPL